MANPNELSVELRLKMDQVRRDAQRAGSEVNKGLASSVKGLPPTVTEQQDARSVDNARRAAIARARRNAQMDLKDDINDASRRNRAAALIRQRDEANTQRLVEEASRRNRAAQLLRQRKQDRDEDNAEKAKDAIKVPLKGIAIATAAAAFAFMTLKKVMDEVAGAANRAAATYAKILQSGGMAAGFVVKREQLANIIGVSEDQVMQYGSAIAYLNSRLEWSTKIFTETNPTLTALSWNLRIVENDFAAMIAKISTDGAPAFKIFLDFLDQVIKKGESVIQNKGSEIAAIAAGAARVLTPGLFLNVSDFATKDAKKNPLKPVPQAPVSLNRFPASDWQKMGLVIGGGGVNPQEKTAQHTAKMVTQLQTITTLLQPRTGNTKNPANVLTNPMYPQP
jgi:hypothetical protein